MFSDASVDMRPGPRRQRGPRPGMGMRPPQGGMRPTGSEPGVQPMQTPPQSPRPPMRPSGPLPGYAMDIRPPRPRGDQMNEPPPRPDVFQPRQEPGPLGMPNRMPRGEAYIHNFGPNREPAPEMNLHETEENMQGMGYISPMPAPVQAIAYNIPRPVTPGIPIAPGIRIPVPKHVDAINEAAHLEAQHKQAVEMLLRIQEKVGAGHKPTPQEAHFVQVMARPLLALR